MIVYLMLVVLLLTVMMIVGLVQIREMFTSAEIPVEYIYESTLDINTLDDHFDFFIKDLLTHYHHVKITPIDKRKRYRFLKCSQPDCSDTDAVEYPNKDYGGILLYGADLDSNSYIQVTERYADFLPVPERQLRHDDQMPYGVDPTRYYAVKVLVTVQGTLSKNVAIRGDQLQGPLRTNRIKVLMVENGDVRKLFDVYACIWDDATKTATCQRIQWQRELIFDIDMFKNFDMIRVVPKTHKQNQTK